MDKISNIISLSFAKLLISGKNLSTLSLSSKNFDIILILTIFVAAFVYGINAGRTKMILSLISAYISILLIKFFPYQKNILDNFKMEPFVLNIILFFIIFIVTFYFLSRSPIKIANGEKEEKSWFQILILSIFNVGIFLSLIISFLPNKYLKLNETMGLIFANQKSLFWWIAVSILFMAIIKKRR